MTLRLPPSLVVLLALTPAASVGQQLEPRAYEVAPVGLNAFLVTYNTMAGDINFDPTFPVEDVSAVINSLYLGYFRSIDFFGRSASVAAVGSYTIGSVQGRVLGEFVKVDRSGLDDPAVRFAVNLYGGPAMTLEQFADYEQKWVVGASFVAVPPGGQYDPDRLINIGANRWSFKPEVGVTRTMGRWTLEWILGAWLFTANRNFMGSVQTQQPIGSGQMHVSYTFKPGLWAAFNANFYVGGRTSVDGVKSFDLQRNSRVGATVSIPLSRHHSLKAAYSAGAYTTIGADFQAITVAYQYVWGRGF